MNLKALYITDSINSLDAISQKGNVIHTIKKSHRLTHFANKMMGELLQCQDDQEKCYILCRRYINLVDHLFKISDDQNYANALHSTDYRKVKQLANELKESLLERYKLAVESPLEINKVIQSRPPVDTTQIKENVPKFRACIFKPLKTKSLGVFSRCLVKKRIADFWCGCSKGVFSRPTIQAINYILKCFYTLIIVLLYGLEAKIIYVLNAFNGVIKHIMDAMSICIKK